MAPGEGEGGDEGRAREYTLGLGPGLLGLPQDVAPTVPYRPSTASTAQL